MSDTAACKIIASYCQSHQLILSFMQKLSDGQLRWRPPAGIHSIAFHGWHIARWADHLQAAIPGMSPELGQRLPPGVQLWQTDELAVHWQFASARYGYADTGMGMPDEIAMSQPFPDKVELMNYVERVFTLAELAVNAIDDQQFQSDERPQPFTEGIWGGGTVGDAILTHLTHDNRHLGMMECLLGLQGKPGTASQ